MTFKTFSDSELHDQPDKVFAEAAASGSVHIVDRNGNHFVLRPAGVSPLDVPGVKLNVRVTTDEIVQMVRESREEERSWEKLFFKKPKTSAKSGGVKKRSGRSVSKNRKGAA